MKLISFKKTGHKNYTLSGNDYFIAGLFVFIFIFALISLLCWNVYQGFIWASALIVLIIPMMIIRDRMGKKRHASIHNSKLFRGLKEVSFKSETYGAYKGLIRNIDGRTVRIYYDWNKVAKGGFSFGDVVIELFYEPIIELYNDFEPRRSEITALNKKYKLGYSIHDWRYFTVDRLVIAVNYYPWTRTADLLRRIDQAIKILEIEKLSPFDVENVNDKFKKQAENGFFLPRINME